MQRHSTMTISFLSGILFVLVFAVVVLIHEFGHFLVARLFGVEVEEFGIGIPPRILTLFHWKGTAFTLNWLPFGGFVRPKGENDPSVPGGLAASPAGVRLAVLLAGPVMNLLLGVLVYSILFSQIGIPDFDHLVISEVDPNSPAASAGIREGDIVLKAAGQMVHTPDELREIILAHLDQPLPLTVEREGEIIELTATPSSKRPEEIGALGIVMGYPLVPPPSWLSTLPISVDATIQQAYTLVALPARILRGTASPEEGRLIGLKGIWDIFRQAVGRDVESRAVSAAATGEEPTHFTLNLIAMLTITLGVFNLVPLPALDGGRILFVLPEIVFRKRVSPRFENVVHAIGLALLLALMLYINVMDFINPAQITLP